MVIFWIQTGLIMNDLCHPLIPVSTHISHITFNPKLEDLHLNTGNRRADYNMLCLNLKLTQYWNKILHILIFSGMRFIVRINLAHTGLQIQAIYMLLSVHASSKPSGWYDKLKADFKQMPIKVYSSHSLKGDFIWEEIPWTHLMLPLTKGHLSNKDRIIWWDRYPY